MFRSNKLKALVKYQDRFVLIPLFFNVSKFLINGHDDNGCLA